ncbi:hypothetical protein N7462_009215 [Penicillium macrosclerotiorum]|uniref:uncharacterized protein n=1 Tax=Penicillium macrosclerotiorum TaxID=303699 RepID=UPI002547D0F2|nr:uncharacterized protein N7462_009215 [Penicillium macrosclerotiorum]KAJ5673776.1 hypothetical protein N7462_009215 [Penicillium macrosclerotiorum]
MRPQIIDITQPSQGTPELGAGSEGIQEKPDLVPERQDAFGDEEHAEVKYKVLKWWQGGLLMVSETISLGILSLPAAIAGLGLVPGLIVLIGFGILASYTGYVIGQFKWRYPHISSMADAGEMLMGRFGRELFGTAQLLFLVFIMASHILTFTVALNVITNHATCSIVFGVVAFISIFTAVMITMIAVGIRNPDTIIHPTSKTNLVTACTAAANIGFSYVSHNTFFTFMAELQDARDFPKALALLQTIDMTLYIVAAVVIYRFAGPDVASPALGSAGPLISKIAYGVALPTVRNIYYHLNKYYSIFMEYPLIISLVQIVIAGVINSHVAAKSIYIRLFAGTDRMHKRDWVAVSSWIGISFGLWIIAWIIASSIPVFSDLVSLITALFGSWFTFGFTGMFWFYMNKGLWFSSPRKIFLTALNAFIICVGVILCALGLYTSGKSIHDNPSGASFSCANNA